MKKLLIAILISIPMLVSAADEISLTASGNGSTQDAAVKSALRNAIEQAYGAFISTNTQVLNNKLVKDEIVSLSQGVVTSYNIVSSAFIKENNTYFVTVKAVVSMNTMASFVNSKTNSSVKVSMGVFDANIKLAELNKQAEKKILNNLVDFIATVPHLFSYELSLDEPFVSETYENVYELRGYVKIMRNENTQQVINLIQKTFKSLSLTEKEREDYEKWRLPYYGMATLNVYLRNEDLPFVTFRSNDKQFTKDFDESLLILYAMYGFSISDNVNTPTNYYYVGVCNALRARAWRLHNHVDDICSGYINTWKEKAKLKNKFGYISMVDLDMEQVNFMKGTCHHMFSNSQIVSYVPVVIYIPISEASKYTDFVLHEERIVVKGGSIDRFFKERYSSSKK